MPEAHFPHLHRGELRPRRSESDTLCRAAPFQSPEIQMECLGWELRICAEFTPVPDFLDRAQKTARGEGFPGRAAFLAGV
jgi:hypothetical protein